MITSIQATNQVQDDWQHSLAQAVTDPAELVKILNLPEGLLLAAQRSAATFPLKVTQHYLSLIKPGDPTDPLLRQILPVADELIQIAGYQTDPVDDTNASIGNGLLQKYPGRALMITTGACAIHCRYCFRRHYPYAENHALRHWDKMLYQLRKRPGITEVILSGGDPLSLADKKLGELIRQIDAIPHIQRLRLHTRQPIALPQRITSDLVNQLSATRLQTSLVLHCNHPNELHPALKPGLQKLSATGTTLLNQSVLLADVNDTADTLIQLSEDLFAYGVLPYYLHLLDPVQGAAHFAVSNNKIEQIKNALRSALPGYLVPRIVKEIPGATAKTLWEDL